MSAMRRWLGSALQSPKCSEILSPGYEKLPDKQQASINEVSTVKCGQGFSTNSGFGSAPLLAQGSRASPASLSQQRATRRDWEGYNYIKCVLFAKPQRCRNRNRNLHQLPFI